MQVSSNGLKVRAKRLRAAIKSVLRANVSHAQSLELVAQEENYPTWDAACACIKIIKPEGNDFRWDFVSADQVKIENSCILIGGKVGTGKSTLAHNIANRIAEKYGGLDMPLPVILISTYKEWPTENFISTLEEDFENQLALFDLKNCVLFIDESYSRGNRSNEFWLDLVSKARGAVVTIHCGDGIETIEPRLLEMFQFVSCNPSAKSSH